MTITDNGTYSDATGFVMDHHEPFNSKSGERSAGGAGMVKTFLSGRRVSVGLIAFGVAAVTTLLTRYAGLGVVSGGAIATVTTGGVLGTTWLTRRISRRRIFF